MSSKLRPWGAAAVRNLTIRTRPTTTTTTTATAMRGANAVTAASAPQAVMIPRRGYADDMYTRQQQQQPPYDPDEPPPPPPPQSGASEYPPPAPEAFAPNFLNAQALAALEQEAHAEAMADLEANLKFGLPPKAGKQGKLQDRHHPVVHQITRLLMRDGELSKAQRHLAMILNYLRTSPAPRVSPLRPLLPGSPPPHQLPLNPLLYLTLAIDSVAPLIRVRNLKGMAGGGQALELPEPIPVRTRRRIAMKWILDTVNKKPSSGSGRAMFATRFGQEIVSVVEGRSGVWDKRQQVHKLGVASRANLTHPNAQPGRRK
ncbi:ribosomal protein S7 domain-containing protein [Xylariomycetidae sp. FL0641]|nr:ribosomal protein S7 domain-containing protein [Xylariomycetidae sp. FL0641]